MRIEFLNYAGGGFLLHPETQQDQDAIVELISAEIASLTIPGTGSTDGSVSREFWPDGAAFIPACPYGANFGRLLFGLAAHGIWESFVTESARARVEYEQVMAHNDALPGLV